MGQVWLRKNAAVAVGLASCSLVLLAAAFAGGARGDFGPGWYSHANSDPDCGSGSRIDPVGAVFYRTINTTVGTHIEHHTGWSNQSGGTQRFLTDRSPYTCVSNTTQQQRASDCGTCDRFHVRFSPPTQNTYNGTAGNTAIGTPHYETYNYGPDCWGSHAVSSPNGFNRAKYELRDDMGAVHYHFSQYEGNTASIKQCDNEYAGSDGYVVYFRIVDP